MKVPDVYDMVADYLRKNGYDGLVRIHKRWLVDDIAPCGQINGSCLAGYKRSFNPELDSIEFEESEWVISIEKPSP